MKTETPAQRIARAMIMARRKTFIPTAHLAKLLGTDAATLKQYEFGREDVPTHILERLFTLGYLNLHMRDLNRNFRHLSYIIFKYGKSMTAIPDKRKI